MNQNKLLLNTDEIAQFWTVFEQLIANFEITEDKHYRIINNYKTSILHVPVKAIYPKYREYCIKLRMNFLDEQSLKILLKSSKAFIPSDSEQKDSHTIRFSGKGNKTKSTYAFNLSKLNFEALNQEIPG